MLRRQHNTMNPNPTNVYSIKSIQLGEKKLQINTLQTHIKFCSRPLGTNKKGDGCSTGENSETYLQNHNGTRIAI